MNRGRLTTQATVGPLLAIALYIADSGFVRRSVVESLVIAFRSLVVVETTGRIVTPTCVHTHRHADTRCLSA